MKITLKACRGITFRYFLKEGWLPPGTTNTNWPEATMGDLMFDDPPLDSDPHFQKKRASIDLQTLYFVLGSSLDDPLSQFKKTESTLGEFAEWCFQHNS